MTTKLILSPEVLAKIALPLSVSGGSGTSAYIRDANDFPVADVCLVGRTRGANAQLAAFIAALTPAALTPAADAAPTEPDHGQVDLEQASTAGRAGVTS